MDELGQSLERVLAMKGQTEREQAYQGILARCVAQDATVGLEGLRLFVEHVSGESVSLALARSVFIKFSETLSSLPDATAQAICIYALEKLQPRVISFGDQVSTIRKHLADVYEKQQMWTEAAKTLIGIPLDGHRNVTTDYKVDIYLKIAMLYLEDDNPVDAEAYVNRAAAFQAQASDAILQLKYKACYARVLDAKRRFIEAAQRYYELSTVVSEAERGVTISLAINCTILAGAGMQRSRLLATLYKDERTQQTEQFTMLEKMYLGRIIQQTEADAFASHLSAHQLARLADGSTILERAVLEHNLLSASQLYANISFAGLKDLLGVAEERQAQRVAAHMVSEGRLDATIDQIAGLIHFEGGGGKRGAAVAAWDAQIEGVCEQVNGLVDAIETAFPGWCDQYQQSLVVAKAEQ